jgi:hypothetical protein
MNMETFWLYVIGLTLVGVTQYGVYLIYQRTKRIYLAMLPNLGVFALGVIVTIVGYVVALSEPSSWAGLGALILFFLTLFATFVSTITSGLMIYLLTILKKKQR